MLTLRDGHRPEELDKLSSEIVAKLIQLPEVRAAQTVSTYLNIGSEVRTSGIVDWLLANQKEVIIPITDKANKRLIFSELRDRKTDLQRGTFGILEPKPERRIVVPLEQADLTLVPGVAWDLRGYRIGYGGGYYDRSIGAAQNQVQTIGLSYEFQIIERVPNNPLDKRVNKLATEDRVVAIVGEP